MKDDYVSIEHLILGILKSNDNTSQLLKDSGFSIKMKVTKIVKELRKGQRSYFLLTGKKLIMLLINML